MYSEREKLAEVNQLEGRSKPTCRFFLTCPQRTEKKLFVNTLLNFIVYVNKRVIYLNTLQFVLYTRHARLKRVSKGKNRKLNKIL